MKIIILSLFIFISSLGFNTIPDNSYSGYAIDVKSNRILYKENHEEFFEKGKHISTTTIFKNSSDVIIASRTIDFLKGYTTPSFRLSDNRDGSIEGAELRNDSVVLYSKKNARSKLAYKTLKVPSPFVIDGGFNYFIKNNWDLLSKGNVISFNFVVPALLDYYKFRISKTGETVISLKKAMVIKLEPDNFILRSIVNPIIITYDLKTKRIITYEGISNISDEKGNNYIAKLIYPQTGP